MRTCISGLLIFVLLPLSSMAAVCQSRCTMGMPPAVRASSPVIHTMHAHADHLNHHHTTDEAGQPFSHPNSTTVGHSCCHWHGMMHSLFCLGLMDGAFLAQAVTPKFGSSLAMVQGLSPCFLVKYQDLERHSTERKVSFAAQSRLPVLRI